MNCHEWPRTCGAPSLVPIEEMRKNPLHLPGAARHLEIRRWRFGLATVMKILRRAIVRLENTKINKLYWKGIHHIPMNTISIFVIFVLWGCPSAAATAKTIFKIGYPPNPLQRGHQAARHLFYRLSERLPVSMILHPAACVCLCSCMFDAWGLCVLAVRPWEHVR